MTAVNVTLTKYMGSQIIFKEVYMWEIRVWKLVLLELSRIGSFLCLSGGSPAATEGWQASAFQASACITFAYVPWSKASWVAKSSAPYHIQEEWMTRHKE